MINFIALMLFVALCCSGCDGTSLLANDSESVTVHILDAEYQAKRTSVPDLPDSLDENEREVESLLEQSSLPNRIVMLTADWCVNCKRVEQESLLALRAKGWSIGPGPENQIQTVRVQDAQETNTAEGAAFLKQYGVTWRRLPAFLQIRDGQVASRSIGYRTAQQIGDLWPGKISRAQDPVASIDLPSLIRVNGDLVEVEAFIQQWHRGRAWTYPGSIENYLREHGLSGEDIQSLSADQRERLHAAIHEQELGTRSQSSATPFVQGTPSMSNCPDGSCERPRGLFRKRR